jgi:integrase
VLRNLTRDAVHQLDLPRDPTARVTFSDRQAREGNTLSGEALGRFLEAMRKNYPRNHALAAMLAFTGLRFCHASAIKWEDIDEAHGVIRIQRKQRNGIVGSVSRRKRAPRELPVVPELLEILRDHRKRFAVKPAPGVGEGWVFLSDVGTLRTPGSLVKAWQACAKAAGVTTRFTVHGLRRTFNDLARRGGVDAVVTKAITGHVTEEMREHYSSVDLAEKRAAMVSVMRLVPRPSDGQVGEKVGVGPNEEEIG